MDGVASDGLSEDLDAIEAHYAQGRFRSALASGARLGEPTAWPGPRGRLLGAKISRVLGSFRRYTALVYRAHRDTPSDPSAARAYARLMLARRGPWYALRWMHRAIRSIDGLDEASFHGCFATAYRVLRDFERSHAHLDRLREQVGPTPRGHSSRAAALFEEDRRLEAREEIERSLALAPNRVSSLLLKQQILTSLGHREEALAVSDGAPALEESFELLWAHAEIEIAAHDYEAAARHLDQAYAAAVLRDRALELRMTFARAEAAYLCRRYGSARALLEPLDIPFARSFRERLEGLCDGDAPRRRELEAVPYVRQHYVTCAPASLASITASFGDVIDQAEIAEAICYAGTPEHEARRWAEERGYAVRAFDVTFDAVEALIDRGIPVYLATGASTTSHAQVIVGYDHARSSLLIRDPSRHELAELTSEALEEQRWCGPLGVAMVPAARASDLDGLDLVGAEERELRHAIAIALSHHDVDEARRVLDELAARPGAEAHSAWARLALAEYTADASEGIAACDALLAIFPDCPRFVRSRWAWMHGRVSREAQLELLRAREHVQDAALFEAIANELVDEGVELELAAKLVSRALRLNPSLSAAYLTLARLLEAERAPADEQLDAYRFAACVSLMEVHGLDYFDRASVYGREEEALRLLERRVVGAGERSSGPARSLFQAHVSAGHPERGIAVLEAAAKTRPDDGTLAIALVDAHRAHGTTEDAERWLARAETLSVRSDALALARATLARARGDLDAAIAAVDEALSVLPGTPSLVFRRAELVMVREGPTAALAYWESVVDAHPHEPSFLHQLCTQLRTVDDERERGLLQRRLDENREDAWARRELALVLLRLQDDAAALAQADEAIARAPYDPTNHWARGVVLDAMGRDDDARAAHRRAIELSSDAVYSIQALAHLGTAAQVRESARWVLERLSERPGSGVGIAEAFQLSRGLDHEERSAALQRMLDRAPARPDAWEAIARARLEAGDVDGAAEIVERAQALFPRWFSLMRLHAEVLGARGDVEGRVAALRELVVLAPDWTQARVELVSALRASGQFDEALEALDAGLRQTPLDPGLRQQQASLRWREGDREGAFELLLELLREDMLGERQGMTLMAWARALSREDEVDAVLSRWIEARPTATIFPFWRSELRSAPQHEALRVAALEAVLAIDPRDIPARDALAELLASRGEFDAAIATCRLPGGAETPVELRGRAAWVVMYRGDRDEAIAQMRALLEEWPGYGWGHRTLCDWLDAAKDQAGFLSAARALVKQLPSVGLHHVYLGDALASTGAMDDAIASWTRAVELDPYNDYAVRRLMNELLSRDRVDEATALLDRARHALPQADAELLVVRVAVKSARWEDAFRAYETLLGLQGASSSHLFDALSAVATGPREDDAFAAAYEQLFADDPPSGDAIGSAWANAAWTRVSENAPLRLFEHAARLGRAGHAAIAWGIETLANRDRTFGLYWTWLRHRSVMRGVDMLWGAFGYAMYTVQHPWLAMRWLDDWKERTAIRGWMLCNYLLASWANGEPARAREAVEHALTLTADHTLYIHQAWDVFHRSLDAPSSELRARIDGLNVSDDASCGALVPLVHALADAEALGPEADAVARVRAARPRLMDAHAWIGGTPAFRHAYRATARALLARGPWYARLWAWLTWLPPTSG